MSFFEAVKKHPLILILLALCAISTFTIASAAPVMTNIANPDRMWIMQLAYYGIGGLIAFAIYKVGMDTLYRNIRLLYWIFMVLLIGLAIDHICYTKLLHTHIVPFASYVNGSTCWYNFKVFSFQPSEFMKVIMVMYLAQMTKEFNNKVLVRTSDSELKYISEVLKIALPPAVLILLENDTGVIMIMAAACFFILISSGMNGRWFIFFFSALAIIIALMSYLFVYHNGIFTSLISGHRLDRFYGWLDPEGTAGNQGMQLWFAMLSYGTASWFGHGFRASVMSFPEGHTDFIFAVICTDFGYVGALITIAAIVAFDVILLRIGLRSDNERDKHYTMGMIGCLVFQQVWNIGMVLGLAPITGITLPLISYGGSSLLSYLFAMGIFFDIDHMNKITSLSAKGY